MESTGGTISSNETVTFDPTPRATLYLTDDVDTSSFVIITARTASN